VRSKGFGRGNQNAARGKKKLGEEEERNGPEGSAPRKRRGGSSAFSVEKKLYQSVPLVLVTYPERRERVEGPST